MIKSDIKTVITTVNRIKNNEPILNPNKVEAFKKEIKTVTVASYFQENWLWIMTILFAATMAWVLAANYYSIQANNFIIENCMPQVLNGMSYPTSFNFTDVLMNGS